MKRRARAFLVGGTAIATTAVGVFAIFMVQPQTGPSLSGQDFTLSGTGEQEIAELFLETAPMSEDLASADVAMAPQVMARPAPEAMFTSRNVMAGKMMASGEAASQPMTLIAPLPPHEDFPVVTNGDQSRFLAEEIEPVKLVSEEPVSTFSVDVDTASYAHARRMIENGVLPNPDSVRIEEMLNYFPYDYAAPAPGSEDPFLAHIARFESPWNPDNQLVRIGIQGVMPEIEERPDLDLVFLIDTSGSMNSADKLGLLKKSLIMMLPQLRSTDRVGIVTYAGSAGVVLDLTEATRAEDIIAALNRLEAGGGTAGEAGLKAAYSLLETDGSDDRIGRVLLATDGDFNVGMSSVDDMTSYIEQKRDKGAYLSVLGFGTGNYNDALMQALAQNGNGSAAYIDSLSEARKVLVDQLSGALFPIANDVKIQVEWNPEAVREYRLIGYETRSLAREDFNNDKVDAGEIGAGHQVTALYEITLTGSDGGMFEPSRYATPVAPGSQASDELGYVNIRYKAPGESESTLMGTPIDMDLSTDQDAGWVAAIAGFGQLLKDDKYLGGWGYSDAADLAAKSVGEDPFGYRREALQLIRLADVLDRQR